MGINISNQNVQDTINSLTKIVNNTSNSVFQSSSVGCASGVNLSVNVGVYPVISGTGVNQTISYPPCVPQTVIDGDIIVSQFASGSCSLTGGITNTLNASYTANLKQNIQDWIEQQVQQRNGFIAAAIDIANTQKITTENISQMIANDVSNNISQKCDAFVQASTSGTINICALVKKDIIVNQSAIATNITTCLTNNIVTAITNDTVITDIINKTVQKTKQDNQGLGDLARYFIIGAVVIVVIGIIAAALFYIFGNKGSTPAVDPEKLKLSKIREITALKENIAKKTIMKRTVANVSTVATKV